jgi:hypothetical protein
MGGIVGSVVGGIASSSASKKAAKINAQAQADNRAFALDMYNKGSDLIQPEIGYGNSAEGAVNGLLGIGSTADTAAGQAGFQNYRDTSGYQFLMDQGNQAVTQNAAAKGAFQSGATAKALVNYGQGLADTTENNYLSQLNTVANRGTAAKQSLIGQGQALTNTTVDANNSAAKSSSQNAINQGNIINGTLQNIASSFPGGGSGALSTLFGI